MGSTKGCATSYVNNLLRPSGIRLARNIGNEPVQDIKMLMTPFTVHHIIDGGA